MRDHIREKDLEQALDVSAGEVTVDVADDGTATITIKRDHLDQLLATGNHWTCRTDDDIERAAAAGYRDGKRDAQREHEAGLKQKTVAS